MEEEVLNHALTATASGGLVLTFGKLLYNRVVNSIDNLSEKNEAFLSKLTDIAVDIAPLKKLPESVGRLEILVAAQDKELAKLRVIIEHSQQK